MKWISRMTAKLPVETLGGLGDHPVEAIPSRVLSSDRDPL